MNLLRFYDIAFLRLRSLLDRAQVERELDRELSFHFERQVQENIGKGMPQDEARFAAKRSLGGRAQIEEECRDVRRTNQVETIWNDLRYAFRILWRNPRFTTVIVLTLGLGIGANTAVFSVIEGVLLRPLPFSHPDRIVRLYFNNETHAKFPLNPNDFRDFRERNQTFDSVAAMTRYDAQLSGAGDPVMLHAFRVTAGYFRVLGYTPVQGRDITAEDELPAHGRLAILSDRVWRSRFGSDRGIIGRSITLDGQPFMVVGVMPPGVRHPGNNYQSVADGETVDLWYPFTFEGDPGNRGSHYMDGIGRLKPGVSPEQANSDLSAILSQLASEHSGDKGWRVFVVPLYRELVGPTQHMLMVLFGAVGLLLLIACVNAANLLLARASARQREFALRAALGAGRVRIVRQLLTESAVIALAGAALGTLLAFGGVRMLVSSLPAGFPRAEEIRLDPSVFAFTALIALVTGVLFGLVPALLASRTDLQQSLREGGRSATGSGRQLRLRNVMVVGETALACVLLIAAGLMLHSFVNLLRTDPGFRPQQVLTASISLPSAHYKPDSASQFYRQLTTELESLPGVRFAGVGTDLPWTGYDENTGGFMVEGRPASFNDQTTARYHVASPDYFQALGIPLVRGRFFTAHDDKDGEHVLVVNQSMAKRYWPGEDPIGKRISFSDKPQEKDWFKIIGVVGDIRDQADSNMSHPAFWWAHEQRPFRDMSVVVRSDSDAAVLTNQLRVTLRGLDPALAIADMRFMNQVADASVASQRFALFLVGLFAVLALALATIGMYGVISYSVNQRMHEFGIRAALGARPWDLMRLIVGQGLRLSMIGAAIGLLCSVGLTRLLQSLLFGVSGTDPITFVAVALLALMTTTLACYVPARRAMITDPMRSLASE